MPVIALFATQQPTPDCMYAGLPVAGKIVYVRAEDLPGDPDEWEDDEITMAELRVKPNEIVLNTIEV